MHQRRGKTHSVSPKHDLAQHMPGGEALMRLGGVGEGVGRGDRNLRLRRLQRVAEMLELANSCLPVIRDGLDAAPLLRLGLDSVRIGELATVANRFEAARERVASGEREHGIDPIGREAARTLEDIAVPTVDRHVGTKAPNEGHAILTGCGGENTCTAQLRELKRHASDTSRGAVNDHGLSRLHMQRIIDALKRGEPGDGDRARMLQIELAR